MQIGVAANFTDPLSLPIRYGAQLAAEEINAAGGINGRPIELVEREDYADADSAVVVATDFYNSPVVAVIGHGFSGPTLAAAPVYNGGSNPLLEIAPAASAPAVTDAGPYTFRLCPSDLAHGSALAHWARERLGLTRGAVFYTNSEYGRGIRTAFETEFASLDGAVVGSYPYLGDTPDVGPYVDLLSRDKRAQFMLIAGYDPDARTILTEARKKNLTIPAMGGDGLEQIALSGPVANGTYVTSSYFSQTATPANQRFVERVQGAVPRRPASPTARGRPRTTPCTCCRRRCSGSAPTGRRCATPSPASGPPRRRSRGPWAPSPSTRTATCRASRSTSARCATASCSRRRGNEPAQEPAQPGQPRA